MKLPRTRIALALALTFAPAGVALANSPSYVGAKKCRACHLKQFQTWEQTRMAKSFELLKAGAHADAKKKMKVDPQKDYTHDEKCLPCHTTGYGKPGGFVSLEKTPELVGVQCESCHGPGGEYLKEGFMTSEEQGVQARRARQGRSGRPQRGDVHQPLPQPQESLRHEGLRLQLRGAQEEGDARAHPAEVPALGTRRWKLMKTDHCNSQEHLANLCVSKTS